MTLFQEPQALGISSRRHRIGRLFLAFGLILAFAAFFMPAPYVIERPGSATDTLGDLAGAPIVQIDSTTYEADGELNMLTVEVVGSPEQTPSWFDLMEAWLDPSQIITPLEEVFPDNQTGDESDAENAILMDESQQDAAAAALEGLGYKVGRKVLLTQIFKTSPANGILKAGDVVVAYDGKPIGRVEEIRDLLAEGKGAPVEFTVLRGSDKQELKFSVTPFLDGDTYRIGVLTGIQYTFPFAVDFNVPGIGGPSGGLMFALATTEKLTPGSMTGGLNISGTGTIDTDGNVGPIGGIRQKMYAAVRAGSTVMFAPNENCSEVVGHIPAGLTVLKVGTLAEAKARLAAIASGTAATNLPQCTK